VTKDPTERILEADRLVGPHGWIQWKGTDVCMDVHCSCGTSGHVDTEFAYFYRCPCGKVWAVGQSVKLHELMPDEIPTMPPVETVPGVDPLAAH
jgi:hypothetical protein